MHPVIQILYGLVAVGFLAVSLSAFRLLIEMSSRYRKIGSCGIELKD